MGTDTLHRRAQPWTPLGAPERAFLLACLRPDVALPAAMPELDWNRLVARAVGDGLGPLLFRRLQPVAIPRPALERLRHSYYQNLSVNHLRLTELRRLGQLLGAHDIRLLVLKGAALSQTVYRDPALRFMGDLDVAVPPRRAEDALRLLQADGYAVSAEQARPDEAAITQAFGWHVRLRRTVGGQSIELELHWPRRLSVLVGQVARLDLAALWRTALPLDEAANLWQPSRAAMLVHVCLHTGLQHRFADLGLRHYLDVDRLVRAAAGEPGFWPVFVAQARAARARAVCHFCLHLAEALLGTPVPADPLAALAPAPWQQRLFARHFTPADAVNRTRAFYGRGRLGWRLVTTDRPADLLRGPLRALFPSRAFLADYYGTDDGRRLWGYALLHPLRALVHATTRRARQQLALRLQPKRNP